MALLVRSDLLAGRSRAYMQLKDDEYLRRDQFEKMLAEFLRTARQREDLYFRLINLQKRDLQDVQDISAQLVTSIGSLDELSKKLKGSCQFEMPIIEKKTMAYHFCTKLVELLDYLKSRLRADQNLSYRVQQDKQEIMRCYKKQLDSGLFDVCELTECMVGCSRGNSEKARKGVQNDRMVSSFAVSTQNIPNREREYLLRFVRAKQKQQQRKAKLEEANRQQLKELRKRARRIYKIMDCEDIAQNYCLTLNKQQNAEAMFVSVMQRNSIAQKQIRAYEEHYKQQTTRVANFRIKKKHTAAQKTVEQMQQ